MSQTTHAPKSTANQQSNLATKAVAQLDNRPGTVQARELLAAIDGSPRQVAQRAAVAQLQAPPPNRTGLPDKLKAGVETLSGQSLDDVRVHYNSDRPAQLQAHAYVQGSEIHVAPGQEKHLPHEAWHVVQQKQGRVRATRQMKEVAVNDNASLEQEADVMGARALIAVSDSVPEMDKNTFTNDANANVVQRRMGVEAELTVPVTTYKDNSTAESRVRNFLGEGASYKQPFQGSSNGFHIDTDKDPIAGIVRSGRDYVNMQLVNINQVKRSQWGWGSKLLNYFSKSYDQHPLIPQNAAPVANMEYVTDPFDEEKASGQVSLVNTMNSMKSDMQNKIASGKVAMHRQGNFNYGVPPSADWIAFAQVTGIPTGPLLNKRQEIVDAITDKLYIQITAGILPAGIPALQKIAAEDKKQNLTGQVDTLGISKEKQDIIKIQQLVTSQSASVAKNIINALVKKGEPLYSIKKEERLLLSLQGYLSLLNSYIFADAVISAHVGTVGKNMVPFFSKLPLNEAQQALDVRVRPESWQKTEREKLAKLMGTQVREELARVTTLIRQPYYGNIKVNNDSLLSMINNWLPGVLDGQADDFSEAQLEACTTIQPEEHAKSQNILDNDPGNLNPKEKLLALEFRMIRESMNLTPDNFDKFVIDTMHQIIKANSAK